MQHKYNYLCLFIISIVYKSLQIFIIYYVFYNKLKSRDFLCVNYEIIIKRTFFSEWFTHNYISYYVINDYQWTET